MPTISASAARQTLPAQLDRVENGEEIVITRHGRAVAVLVHPDVLTRRRAPEARTRADHIDSLLQQARDEPLQDPAIDPDRADELVETVRAGRAGR
jgi:prevent-host-death family protein